MKKTIKLYCCILFTIIFFCIPHINVKAEESQEVIDEVVEQMGEYDFTEVQQFLNMQESDLGWNVSFEELMTSLVTGQWSSLLSQLGGAMKQALFAEVRMNSVLLGQIILLGVVGAVFSNFSNIFSSSQISETGFFVTYLLLFTCLVTSCLTGISLTSKVAENIFHFMQILLPSYFLAVAFAGGGVTAIALYEFTLIIISVMQWLIFKMLIPLTQVYILLVLTSQIAKEDMLSKLTDLIEQLIKWSLKTMIGVVLGFHMIQGMILPYVDSMTNASVQKVIGIIPGIGQGVNAATQIIVGSGVIIKNTIGASAIIILAGIVALPLIKMIVCIFLYQCSAAIMQPVCDKRAISCISSVVKGYKLLMQIMVTSVLLFVITIAVICSGSNASYFAM